MSDGALQPENASSSKWIGPVCSRAAALRRFVEAATGYRRGLIAVTAGAFSVTAMAPFFFWPVLFLTLPLLLWLATTPDEPPSRLPGLRRAFLDGWWFGFGYFLSGLFWVGEAFLVEAEIFGWLLPFGVTLLPAGLAIFYGLAACLIRLTWRPGIAGILTASVIFAAVEWLRGHVLTGFPWNTLGYALTAPDTLMQSAAVFGIYGLTLWAILVFAAPLTLLANAGDVGSGRRALALGTAIAGLPLASFSLFGWLALQDGEGAPGLHVRVVQPSVRQRDKWLAEKQREIFELHESLSRTNAEGRVDDLAGVDLLVWPEAAMPFRPLEHPDALARIGALLPDRSRLVAGILRVSPRPGPAKAADGGRRPEAFNSLAVFDGDGEVAAIYDKIHLVPFGEYLPFQETLESIGLQSLTRQRGGFSAGPEPRPLVELPGLPRIAGLICYEAIFPSEIIQGPTRPELLVNLTNDGWFGNTTGPRQHLHQTRVRAVEQRLPLIRAANNGISAVYDGYGRLLGRLGLNKRGVIDIRLPPALTPGIYAVWGEAVFVLNAIVFALLAGLLSWRSERIAARRVSFPPAG